MDLVFKGKIIHIGQVEQVTADFRKRVLVVQTDEQYHQTAAFDFTQDRTSKLDFVKVGESVAVHFNIRANEHNSRWFTNLNGWKIEKSQEAAPAPAAAPDPLATPAATPAPTPPAEPAAQPTVEQPAAKTNQASIDDIGAGGDDDLPF